MIYLEHVLQATQGVLHHPGQQQQFQAFSHDTRQVLPGEMFVAVRGERSDGHDYLTDAIRKGAAGLLVEAKKFHQLAEQVQITLTQSEAAIILVNDTRLALQQYASAILQRWQPTVIAITGSVGKTSTKEAIADVLSSQFPTFRSWQNYNDLLGIPLSLGRLEEHHAYAVLELSCDHPGEIAELCRIVRPHIGILTNINPVQLQYFGSLERLAYELSMLLTSLPDGGHFFYNQDDTMLNALVSQYRETSSRQVQLHAYGQASINKTTDATCASVSTVGWDGLQLTLGKQEQTSTTHSSDTEQTLFAPLMGQHHLYTILAAYTIGLHCGLSTSAVRHALTTLTPMPGRLSPLPGINQSQLLDDTHNASPTSMIAGLNTLHTLTPPTGKRIAILGDMLHLGEYEEEGHREVGKHIAHTVDYLITRGERAAIIAETALQSGMNSTHVIMTSTHEDAGRVVRKLIESQSTTTAEETQNVILIKGSEETRMERITEVLMARPWEVPEKLVRQTAGWKKITFMHAERPTWVEIDLNAIGSNTRHIKSLVGPAVQVLVALKADAYGHGAVKVARTVLQNEATMLGVATVSEAVPLREANVTAPILVFGYVPRWQMREAIRLGVSVTLYSLESAHELSQAARALAKAVRVHIKVDTGMGRLGIRYEQGAEIVALAREIQALPGLELEGIYTHFAQSDVADQIHVRIQLDRFRQILHLLAAEGIRPPLIHAANSAATLTLPESHFDMVRTGTAIYGLHPSDDVLLPAEFRPALSFKTQVSQVKWIPEGEGISYGSTYITPHPTKIAVLPVGYADGFRRAPQNWGYVLVHGKEAPILGRVCMDQCMVDVTHIPDVRMGDEVVLIGRQGDTPLTAEIVARRIGTINYEIVSELLARVPRVD
ncbi:MAG TPA: alanine racemase [Dictyobacter sp.]|jgi:alanine racemase|nr:alanine racemase [Dictyobacter sp.]